jgi:hypothetical protein
MLLTKTGDIVLLDPSFACRKDHQVTPVENPSFSAPEQSERRAVPQSDFYSLAATVFFLANGHGVSEVADIEALRRGIGSIDFGAFGLPNFGEHPLIYDLLSRNVEDRPKSYRKLLLDTGTYVPETSLFGVLDVKLLGFLLVLPSKIIIGDETLVKDRLRRLLSSEGWSSISDAELREDVRSFLDGENPWQIS